MSETQPDPALAVLEEWRQDALVTLPLPSGRIVKVRPGTLMELAIAGVLPAPLMAVVMSDGDAPGETDPTHGLELLRSTQELAAAAVRSVQGRDGSWVTVAIDVATFLDLPAQDRTEITRVAVGAAFAEVAVSLATFRDEPTGDGPRDDGADVQPAPVGAAGDNRATRRARPRPGARG